ncbi:hypothetical protein DPMN_110253 [Dreissena polymorpha]|uniref:Uncharacterized protein n=1 Tax=Dreissena polymorpha TaxID=45954 RepID=A0A9D4KCM5_DREPO|nr:hypothetical protein DPMN_110253 [Dreissena polymorpha]
MDVRPPTDGRERDNLWTTDRRIRDDRWTTDGRTRADNGRPIDGQQLDEGRPMNAELNVELECRGSSTFKKKVKSCLRMSN